MILCISSLLINIELVTRVALCLSVFAISTSKYEFQNIIIYLDISFSFQEQIVIFNIQMVTNSETTTSAIQIKYKRYFYVALNVFCFVLNTFSSLRMNKQ